MGVVSYEALIVRELSLGGICVCGKNQTVGGAQKDTGD